MTITGYAHALAARIPHMAEDCAINNAVVLDAELTQLFKALHQDKTMITEVRIETTEAQITQMERACELTEALMAQTLARRIAGMKAEDALPFICDWFKSVRMMGQTQLMLSGIKATVTEK